MMMKIVNVVDLIPVVGPALGIDLDPETELGIVNHLDIEKPDIANHLDFQGIDTVDQLDIQKLDIGILHLNADINNLHFVAIFSKHLKPVPRSRRSLHPIHYHIIIIIIPFHVDLRSARWSSSSFTNATSRPSLI